MRRLWCTSGERSRWIPGTHRHARTSTASSTACSADQGVTVATLLPSWLIHARMVVFLYYRPIVREVERCARAWSVRRIIRRCHGAKWEAESTDVRGGVGDCAVRNV